jgi:hypothetical protein
MASGKTANDLDGPGPLWDMLHFSQAYASHIGPPHHQLRAAFNTLPRTLFTGIHRMALVWSRMVRRAHHTTRTIQVSRFLVCSTLA